MEKNISQEKRIEELEARLKEQEKLGSLGLLSAGIAHEIQNPLNFVINFSKLSGQLLADLADRWMKQKLVFRKRNWKISKIYFPG